MCCMVDAYHSVNEERSSDPHLMLEMKFSSSCPPTYSLARLVFMTNYVFVPLGGGCPQCLFVVRKGVGDDVKSPKLIAC